MLGRTYKIDLEKRKNMTTMGGEGWKQFITQNDLTRKDMLCFSLTGPVPRITVLYICGLGGEEDVYESTVVSHRCLLNDNKVEHLLATLPLINTFIGVPFVTRLTRTNLVQHKMVWQLLFVCSLYGSIYNLWWLSSDMITSSF